MNENNIESTSQLDVFDSIQIVLNQTLSPKFVDLHTKKASVGIGSGFSDIDKITQGFHPGELTTIVVRPGIGKTAFLLSLINNISIIMKGFSIMQRQFFI